ncbi:molybdopterin molybdotransferase MoeA [Flavobacterium sp. UBA6135]|uniref:molybdopterin molybdotransferase MoeA n=1 Tax=Flavobacterium sp. UBA6135 TaxID=1946553 RepID=UPI0025BE3AA3|nr:molybdopterin molybdotransferase MoeA [Flavobacterium sp. UBA6135]
MDFITVQKAFEILEKQIPLPTVQTLPLLAAKDAFVASDIFAPIAVPPFTNAAMDGYAIRWSDWHENKTIICSGIVKAGDTQCYQLSPGEAYKIFTGAPIPEGADTVVMKEWILSDDNQMKFLDKPIQKGDHIRTLGSQTQKNTLILNKGTKISSGVISFLSTFGITHLDVYTKPKVSLVITGDELIAPGETLKFGQIYESNGITLTTLLDDLGIEIVKLFYTKDTYSATSESIKAALECSDVVLITGGISVGDFDFVQASLQSIGINKLFYKVQQKPGKPIFFGSKISQYVFALPGNPAAVFSCFHTYVKPFLRKYMQPEGDFITFKKGTLLTPYQKKQGLTHWVKAYQEQNKLYFLQGQESYRMDAFSRANALVCLPDFMEQCSEGIELNYVDL